MPRQIIIEIGNNGKDVILRKDDTASVFERIAILQAIIQTRDIPVIPSEKNLSTNNNQNGIKPNTNGKANPVKRNQNRKSAK